MLQQRAEQRRRDEEDILEMRALLAEHSGQEVDDQFMETFSSALAEETGALPPPRIVVDAIKESQSADARKIGDAVRAYYRRPRQRPPVGAAPPPPSAPPQESPSQESPSQESPRQESPLQESPPQESPRRNLHAGISIAGISAAGISAPGISAAGTRTDDGVAPSEPALGPRQLPVAVVKIVSVAEMRALEAAAFAAGVSEAALQARAGREVADEVASMVLPGQRVVVLVGHGNNGRDGALAATALAARGIGVELILAPRHAVTDAELRTLRGLGAIVCGIEDGLQASGAIQSARVALDAISGIGIQGALREPLASMARMVNEAPHLEVVALDIPSGIDADSGEVLGDAVRADTTVTLGAVKQGLLRFPAAEHVGRLVVRDIGIPPAAGAELPYRCLAREDCFGAVQTHRCAQVQVRARARGGGLGPVCRRTRVVRGRRLARGRRAGDAGIHERCAERGWRETTRGHLYA